MVAFRTQQIAFCGILLGLGISLQILFMPFRTIVGLNIDMLFLATIIILSRYRDVRLALAVGFGGGFLAMVFASGVFGVPVRLLSALVGWLLFVLLKERDNAFLVFLVAFLTFMFQSIVANAIYILLFNVNIESVWIGVLLGSSLQALANSLFALALHLALGEIRKKRVDFAFGN